MRKRLGRTSTKKHIDPKPDETTRMVVEVAERLGVRLLLSRGWAGLGEGTRPESVLADQFSTDGGSPR